MREARLLKNGEVFICEITQGARLREVSDAGALALMSSIKELGRMKDEIHIRRVRHQGNALKLIAGAHRLEAAKRLGWKKIPAKIWDCGDDWANLLEIDDNLSNPALAPLDLCLLLVARKRAYEKAHPETRQGFWGNQHKEVAELSSFTKNTAEKHGITSRQVRKIIQAGAGLSCDEVAGLRRSARAPRLKDLLDFGKITTPEARSAALSAYIDGGAQSIDAAYKQAVLGISPDKSKDATLSRALAAFGGLSKGDKTRFLELIHPAIEEIFAIKNNHLSVVARNG